MYPNQAMKLGGMSHAYLSDMLNSRNDHRWQDIKKEIEIIKPKRVVLSTENLTLRGISSVSFEQLKNLRSQLTDYQVKIIIYLRRQDIFLDSYYRQLVKKGYVRHNIYRFVPRFIERYNYELILEQWAELFGVENIIVRCFEKEQLVNQNIYDDFLVAIAFPKDSAELKLLKNEPLNVSPSVKVIKLLAWLNSINRGKRREFLQKIPNFSFDKFLIYLYENPTVSSWVTKIPDNWLSNELLTLEDRQQIMAECNEINEKIARKYLGRSNGQLFLEKLS